MEKTENKKLINDLTEGNVMKTLLFFSFPLMLSNMLQVLYNMVDMIFIGQFVGEEGLSAVSIGGDVLHLLMFFAIGLSGAGQVILAHFVGQKDLDKVSKTIGTMFSVILGCGLFCSFLCIFELKHLLVFLNTPKESFAYAESYCFTCAAGLVFIYGYNMVSAILRGMGDSKHPLIFVAVATGSNVILDTLFVPVLRLGTFGAALATVIGQGISFVWALIFLYRNRAEFGFDFRLKSFKPNREVLPALIRLGIPMCLQSIAIGLSMIFVNSYINAYGVIASAVTGMGNKLASVTSVVTLSLSTAGSSMVGQCRGAKKYDRVPKILLTNLWISFAFAGILSIATIAFPNVVFGMFTKDQKVLEMAMVYIPIAVLLYGGFAMRSPAFTIINGSGNGKLNLLVAILDGVICRIGLAMLFGLVFDFGIMGFWYGNALAGFVPGLIGGAFYLTGKWRT